jgi:clan AA aspartic protease
MGTFVTQVEVGNMNGGDFMQVEALVDTGSLHSVIPESDSEQLHMQQEGHEEFQLADGSLVVYPVGTARVRVHGRTRGCPIIFGPDTDYILGATSLEILGFMVDPIGEQLIPVTRRARPL